MIFVRWEQLRAMNIKHAYAWIMSASHSVQSPVMMVFWADYVTAHDRASGSIEGLRGKWKCTVCGGLKKGLKMRGLHQCSFAPNTHYCISEDTTFIET